MSSSIENCDELNDSSLDTYSKIEPGTRTDIALTGPMQLDVLDSCVGGNTQLSVSRSHNCTKDN